MPRLKTYDVFISHAWSYHDNYYRMVNFLNDAPRFNWRNYSVPEHDPLELPTIKASKNSLEGRFVPSTSCSYWRECMLLTVIGSNLKLISPARSVSP